MILKLSFPSDKYPKQFRFQSMWTSHKTFQSVVLNAWNKKVTGRPMKAFHEKLKLVKKALQTWNKEEFSNIFNRVQMVEEDLIVKEATYDLYPSMVNRENWQKAAAKFNYELRIEEMYWRQKANIKWVQQGDQNSSYFHSLVKKKFNSLAIHRIKNDSGDWLEKEKDIENEIINHFQSLLGTFSTCINDESIFDNIPKLINEDTNNMLTNVPSKIEIKNAIFSLGKNSAAGPDGFNGAFFQNCWHIIKKDITLAIQSYFLGDDIPTCWSSTNIILIPKNDNPVSCKDFRPISLCNFTNKIISKILANRIGSVLPNIISQSQAGFIKGRSISDNILLAQELLASFNKQVRGGNVVIKLDMSKAYDRLSWHFIIKVLRAFGFSEVWIDLIWRMISNCWYSILINGKPSGFFKSNRGVRQGDPLSPALFVIASEALNRGIQNLAHQHKINHFSIPSGCPLITSLSFADDILFFINGHKRTLTNFMSFLTRYEFNSGQIVNSSKSCFITPPKCSQSRAARIKNLTGFQQQNLPIKYLGVPLFMGRKRKSIFYPILKKVTDKISFWNSRILTHAGRLVLIKTVLQTMGLHIFASIAPTLGVIRDIDKVCANFFWGRQEDMHKHHWIAWSQFCLPREEGGLGLRDISDICKVYTCKLWVNFLQNQTLWAHFMHKKYKKLASSNFKGSIKLASPTWKRMQHIWQLSNSNEFFMAIHSWIDKGFVFKIAWDFIRKRDCIQFSSRMIWDKHIMAKVSIFMWRLLQNGLPLDQNLKDIRIPLVSKCQCCLRGFEEDKEHLFNDGDIASQLWKHFEGLMGMKISPTNIKSRLLSWWFSSRGNNIYSILCKIIPSLICWNIWCARNNSFFEGQLMKAQIIMSKIHEDIRTIF